MLPIGQQIITIHILPNISRSIFLDARNTFLQESCRKWGMENSSRSLFVFLKSFNVVKQGVSTLDLIGMSSLFINLILRTPHYLHMKVLIERISKSAHLSFYHKRFLIYLHLKFEKEVIFLGRFSPYEIPESGDKIPNFRVFKIAF